MVVARAGRRGVAVGSVSIRQHSWHVSWGMTGVAARGSRGAVWGSRGPVWEAEVPFREADVPFGGAGVPFAAAEMPLVA